jgi:hypothetical protein
MHKTDETKLGLEKFTVSKINNQRRIFGGDEGSATVRPKTLKTRPTKKVTTS